MRAPDSWRGSAAECRAHQKGRMLHSRVVDCGAPLWIREERGTPQGSAPHGRRFVRTRFTDRIACSYTDIETSDVPTSQRQSDLTTKIPIQPHLVLLTPRLLPPRHNCFGVSIALTVANLALNVLLCMPKCTCRLHAVVTRRYPAVSFGERNRAPFPQGAHPSSTPHAGQDRDWSGLFGAGPVVRSTTGTFCHRDALGGECRHDGISFCWSDRASRSPHCRASRATRRTGTVDL